MTSTGINVGLGEDTRNSSRVLRPPGGGHTNIFGSEGNDAKATRKDHGRNASSILEGTNTDVPPAIPVKAAPPPPEPPKVNNDSTSSTQQKGRVPPGGFSTKLW